MRKLIILISLISLHSCAKTNKSQCMKEEITCDTLQDVSALTSPNTLDSLFDVAGRDYYAEHLNGQDVRDLVVSTKGFTTITFGGKTHHCYNVLVTYSIYQNNEWYQTHYKNWYWDLQEMKCYWYSDYSQKRKPGEPYRGMMTSVSYIDFSKESFAQKGFQILKRLQNE